MMYYLQATNFLISLIHNDLTMSKDNHLFPFERLCVLHNISQLLISVAPPLLHAVT